MVNSPSDADQLPLTAAPTIVHLLSGSYFGSLRRPGGGARDLRHMTCAELWVFDFIGERRSAFFHRRFGLFLI